MESITSHRVSGLSVTGPEKTSEQSALLLSEVGAVLFVFVAEGFEDVGVG
jgi:hypothetical protein